jgi:hypothetical protein
MCRLIYSPQQHYLKGYLWRKKIAKVDRTKQLAQETT